MAKYTYQFHNDHNSNYSLLYQMLFELRLWGMNYLYVVDSKTTGMVRINTFLPIYIDKEMKLVPTNRPFVVEDTTFEEMEKSFGLLSNVLSEIVPGLNLRIKDYGSVLSEDGENGRRVELIAKRDNIEIPHVLHFPERKKDCLWRVSVERYHLEVVILLLPGSELFLEILEGVKLVRGIEFLGVLPVTALDFTVMKGRKRKNQLKLKLQRCMSFLKKGWVSLC